MICFHDASILVPVFTAAKHQFGVVLVPIESLQTNPPFPSVLDQGRRFKQDAQLPERRLSAADVRRIYDRHGPALVACACALLSDYSLAEDIVHNVFLRALRGDLAFPESPLAYFYRAVKNTALNAQRDRRRESPLPATDDWLVHKGGDRIASIALQRGLERLPTDQREIVILHHWSGLTFEEAAEALGISSNTAASRYRYALEKLRDHFQSSQKREVRQDVSSK
jgi:RNA polymerase sigma-70 factor (ECF subfamily)